MRRFQNCGWASDLASFVQAPSSEIIDSLHAFIPDAGPEQLAAWRSSIPKLQLQLAGLVAQFPSAASFSVLVEYEIPREARRPDVIVLANGQAFLLELKGLSVPKRAFIDQAFAYGRDLGCYHRDLENVTVVPLLVLGSGILPSYVEDGVVITSIEGVQSAIATRLEDGGPPLRLDSFLDPDAYRPLPSLIRAARALFAHDPLPTIKRAAAATNPAVERISQIAHEAALSRTRRLVLVSGVPGAGKTLVGLRAVHDGRLDDLAVVRNGAPAVFLSGNGPLVQVLQDALKDAGGGGKTFVRGVKDYIRYYSRGRAVPPEHLLVSDEAQRAWDAQQVAAKHTGPGAPDKSEPELFIQFAERIPEWCVFVGLIGTGQEIHVGEEGGIVQWRRAIEGCRNPRDWTVHAPVGLLSEFIDSDFTTIAEPTLSLDTEIRYHLAPMVHNFVEALLEQDDPVAAAPLAGELDARGFRFLLTRDLGAARDYIRSRYTDVPLARCGIMASSKARELPQFDIDNSFMAAQRLRVGPWYNAAPDDPRSCCQLVQPAREFDSQGLELDFVLLAWGSDLMRLSGRWDISRALGTRGHVRDPFQLRLNAYRVLLTRGRDGAVIFVPPLDYLDETYRHLQACGVREL